MIRELKGPGTSTRQEGGGREGTSGKMQPSVCEESQQGKGTALFSTVPKGGCGPKDGEWKELVSAGRKEGF